MSFRSGANSDLTLANLTVNRILNVENLAVAALAVTGDATVDGTLEVDNDMEINGECTIAGDLSIDSNLEVTGTSVFNGGVTAAGGFLGVVGNFAATYIFQNGATDLIINNSNNGSDVVINIDQPAGGGNVIVNDNCIDSNFIVATGDLNVYTGNIVVDAGSVAIATALSVGGTLEVIGDTTLNNVTINGTVTAPNIPTMEILYYHMTGDVGNNTTATMTLVNNTTGTTNYSVFSSVYYGYTGSAGTYNINETSASLNTIVITNRTNANFQFTVNATTGQNMNIYLVFLVVYNVSNSNYPSVYSA